MKTLGPFVESFIIKEKGTGWLGPGGARGPILMLKVLQLSSGGRSRSAAFDEPWVETDLPDVLPSEHPTEEAFQT